MNSLSDAAMEGVKINKHVYKEACDLSRCRRNMARCWHLGTSRLCLRVCVCGFFFPWFKHQEIMFGSVKKKPEKIWLRSGLYICFCILFGTDVTLMWRQCCRFTHTPEDTLCAIMWGLVYLILLCCSCFSDQRRITTQLSLSVQDIITIQHQTEKRPKMKSTANAENKVPHQKKDI